MEGMTTMPAIILSNKAVLALPARSQTYISYDSKLAGFGCRVTVGRPQRAGSSNTAPTVVGVGLQKKRITLGEYHHCSS